MEFAIIFPFLLVLAVSIADYGYYLEHVNNVTTVVRDGTRYASLNDSSAPSIWTDACPDPSWNGSTSEYSCPTTVYSIPTVSGDSFTSGTSYTSISVASVPTPLPVGADLRVGGSTGPEVILTAGAGASTSPVSLSISPWTPDQSYSNPTLYWYPASNNVEAVVQQEAESLTVPEGGLAMDNIDCGWGAGWTPSYGGTPTLPTSFPASSGDPGTPTSCMTITYFSSSDGSYSTSSLSAASDLVGWWSADSDCFKSSAGSCTTTYPASGDVVQISLIYAWASTNPGPVFTVLNSTFGLQANIVGQYALVIEA